MKCLSKLLLLVGVLLFCNCSKETNDELPPANETPSNQSEVKESEYYVKYVFSCGNNVYFCMYTAQYINEKGVVCSKKYGANTTASHGSRFYSDEITCGPFKFGDRPSLDITNQQSISYRQLEIHVSKDGSPFAIKASSNSSHIDYTIEY